MIRTVKSNVDRDTISNPRSKMFLIVVFALMGPGGREQW